LQHAERRSPLPTLRYSPGAASTTLGNPEATANAFTADVGWGLRGDEVLAADVKEVGGVDSGGLNLDEGLAGTWCGSLELDEFEDVSGFADSGDLEFTHANPSVVV